MSFDGTLFLLDPVSIGKGHCETFGKGMIAHANRLGVRLKTLTSEHLPQNKISAFNALPIFPHSVILFSYVHVKRGEVDIEDGIDQYVEAMHRFSKHVTSKDILWDYYVYSCPQLLAYVRWLKETPENRRPRVVANLDWFQDFFPEWLEPARDDFKELQPWLRLASASPTNPKRIENLLGVPVMHTPRPLDPTPTPAANGKRIKVGYMGQPSKLKSFHLYGDMVEQCLQETDIDFIFNFRDINYEPECLAAKNKLIDLAQQHPDRITYFEGLMEYQHFKQVMSGLSGVLVAYDPNSHFRDTPSGTVVESLMVETLPIALEGTSMVSELRQFNISAPVIAEPTTQSFVTALIDLEANYFSYIQQNKEPLKAWHAFQSYEKLFEKILIEAWSVSECAYA